MKKFVLFVSAAMMILMFVTVGLATMQLSQTMDYLSMEVHDAEAETILARNGGDKLGLEGSGGNSAGDVLVATNEPESNESNPLNPLGVTKTHGASKSRTILSTVVVQVAIIGALTVMALLMGMTVWRQAKRSKNVKDLKAHDNFRVENGLTINEWK